MRQPLLDKARRYAELQEEIEEIKNKIAEVQKDTLGVESDTTAEKARELFEEVGSATNGEGFSKQIDEMKSEREELSEEMESVKSELLEQISDIRFPLDKTIQNDGDEIVFPYSEEVPSDVLENINDVLTEEINQNGVTIDTEEIRVKTESTDDAIEAVQQRVDLLRETAEAQYDREARAESLHDRDPKVAGMMYVLKESNTPLTKSEMEKRMGLESGALRGQLYYVLKNDPYLNKADQKVSLTSTGEMVIEEYISLYEEPDFGFKQEGQEQLVDESEDAEVEA